MDWALTGTLIGLIISFCYLLDWFVSKKEEDKQKVTIIKWWSKLDDFNYGEAVHNANISCNEMFNKIYDKRHFSLRCFKVSCCVSLFSVLMLQVICIFCGVIDLYYVPWTLGTILILTVTLNMWIDYISLIETRIILKIATQHKPLILPVLLLIDLLLSAIIFWLCTGLSAYVVTTGAYKLGLTTVDRTQPIWDRISLRLFLDYITCESVGSSILFYSTFSTSIIFYIYCLSTLLFKFVKLSKTRIMVLLEKLEDSDRLFKALGGLLAVVVLFVKAVVELIQYIIAQA